MDSNARFLLKTFRKYYKENNPIMPDRFTRREFGFMFFDRNGVQRHIGFPRPDELTRFMIAQVPSHSYYSTAYYRHPDAPTMDEKQWLGAELIFDLDADHIAGAENMSYDEMLRQIRGEMINLVDSFLLGDLGFGEDQVQLMFSGGRGYHAHVPHEEMLTLGSHERREIVDYVTAAGLNIDWIFPYNKVATSASNVGGATRINVAQDRTVPPADSGGWKLRMRNGLKDVVEDFCTMDAKELKKRYPSIHGSQNKSVERIKEDVAKSRARIFEKNTMATLAKPSQEMLVKIMKEDVAYRLSGEVDEPVTADIKRLIRLPGSVHGKSGLRVTPITRSILTDFNPLEDAVPSCYSDDPVKVTMRAPYDLRMKGERFSLKGETEVPEYAAAFLIGRKAADYGYASERRESLF
jgi:DNA primase small subunit